MSKASNTFNNAFILPKKKINEINKNKISYASCMIEDKNLVYIKFKEDFLQNVSIESLSLEDLENIDNFCCGNIILDNYINQRTLWHDSSVKNYLMVKWHNEQAKEIIGYYSLRANAILSEECGNLCFEGGAIQIFSFAIDKNYQGKKIISPDDLKEKTIASFLLEYCINDIENIVEEDIGASCIVLCSTKQGLNLYKRHGFEFAQDEDYYVKSDESDSDCFEMYRTIGFSY